MLVSFLVPVYNVELYLKDCIESILLQTGCEYEIVLLDDGSTDKSGLICDSYKERYPDLIRVIHKENEGLLVTRRRGFVEAKGDWFICVDSDDLIKPNLLSTVVATIKEHDCDMVMYNYEYLDLGGVITKSRLNIKDKTIFNHINKSNLYEQKLTSVDINSMCIRTIKRDILDIDTDYRQCGIRNMCEDAVQVMPLYTNAKRIVYIDEPLYMYRKGQESITANVSVENWMATYKCAQLTEVYLKEWNVSANIKAKYYTRQIEKTCDFIRWFLNSANEDLNKSFNEIVRLIKNDSFFKTCVSFYDKEYASSTYLKNVVPIIIYCLRKERFSAIKLIYYIERILKKRK